MWLGTDTRTPPTETGPGPVAPSCRSMKATRSDCLNLRSRRPPTRRAGSCPESLQRRIEAWLTRRNLAASAVFSKLCVIDVTLLCDAYLYVIVARIQQSQMPETMDNPSTP